MYPRAIHACLILFLINQAPGWAAGPAKTLQFNRDIRPILADACFHCHGPDGAKRKGDLRLDSERDAFADRGGYRLVVPGKPAESELYLRITTDEAGQRMPPTKSGRSLSRAQIERLKRWIEEGAEWEQHWAYLAPERPIPPSVRGVKWGHNPIDAFVLARLEREQLHPSPEASRTTLIRRLTLDLTGLPPTLQEVDAFLADRSPDAYEQLVDRLLESPRYGERMTLDWLDAARYADSNGYQQDRTRVMWPWRDWVVRAFNQNLPFDRFTVEQIAGDLLPDATVQTRLASGFHRNHMLNGEGGRVAEESRIDYVVDRVDTTSTVWLGLTLGCSRCHDHKYDPFTQKDYYQLFAYFNSIAESGGVDRGGNAAPVMRLPTPAQDQRLAALDRQITALQKQAASDLRPGSGHVMRVVLAGLSLDPGVVLRLPDAVLHPQPDWVKRQKRLAAARKERDGVNKSVLEVMVMEDRPQPRPTHILVRGAWDQHGDPVQPGVPAALPPLPSGTPANRLALARWLVDPKNPLTARVAVNRYWQLFFGAGLVKTAEDFGVQGSPPSHPELLDWLATEFVASGWDTKALVRLIVTSATYRQSSRVEPALVERDPENRLLARGPRFRLSAHTLRDQALAVSGLLVEHVGGPPVRPYQPSGIWEEMSFGKIKYEQSHGADLYRRSLYTFWRRTVGPPNLFDTAARQVCTVRQSRTNTPLHALITLNDPTYVEAARALAERLLTEAGPTVARRVAFGFRLATARQPEPAELRILTGSVERLLRQYRADPRAASRLLEIGEKPVRPGLDPVEVAAYTGVASLLLNLDEVLTRE